MVSGINITSNGAVDTKGGCPPLPVISPQDHIVANRNTTAVGSTVVYSCTSTDYVMVGASVLLCQATGKWNGTVPVCVQRKVQQDTSSSSPQTLTSTSHGVHSVPVSDPLANAELNQELTILWIIGAFVLFVLIIMALCIIKRRRAARTRSRYSSYCETEGAEENADFEPNTRNFGLVMNWLNDVRNHLRQDDATRTDNSQSQNVMLPSYLDAANAARAAYGPRLSGSRRQRRHRARLPSDPCPPYEENQYNDDMGHSSFDDDELGSVTAASDMYDETPIAFVEIENRNTDVNSCLEIDEIDNCTRIPITAINGLTYVRNDDSRETVHAITEKTGLETNISTLSSDNEKGTLENGAEESKPEMNYATLAFNTQRSLIETENSDFELDEIDTTETMSQMKDINDIVAVIVNESSSFVKEQKVSSAQVNRTEFDLNSLSTEQIEASPPDAEISSTPHVLTTPVIKFEIHTACTKPETDAAPIFTNDIGSVKSRTLNFGTFPRSINSNVSGHINKWSNNLLPTFTFGRQVSFDESCNNHSERSLANKRALFRRKHSEPVLPYLGQNLIVGNQSGDLPFVKFKSLMAERDLPHVSQNPSAGLNLLYARQCSLSLGQSTAQTTEFMHKKNI